MNDSDHRTHPDRAPYPTATLGFVIGAAATAIAGVLIQVGVVPTTTLSVDHWRYPWEASSAFVTLSIIYAALHALILGGLVAFGRQGIAGSSTAARRGVNLAITGTAVLLAAELASIPLYDALVDDTGAMIAGGLFGLALACSAIGFLLCGWTTLRAGAWTDVRRYTPITTGIWTAIMIPLTAAAPTLLPGSVAVYGLCLLAIAAGMTLDTSPGTTATSDLQIHRA